MVNYKVDYGQNSPWPHPLPFPFLPYITFILIWQFSDHRCSFNNSFVQKTIWRVCLNDVFTFCKSFYDKCV